MEYDPEDRKTGDEKLYHTNGMLRSIVRYEKGRK